jgi:hypothetical protein
MKFANNIPGDICRLTVVYLARHELTTGLHIVASRAMRNLPRGPVTPAGFADHVLTS